MKPVAAATSMTKVSSQFLAIGATVFSRSDEGDIVGLFDEARKERGKDKTFQKFSKCSDADNFVLTQLLAKKPVRIAQVALHKPSMAGSYTRSNHSEEYQYLCKFIIERISWITVILLLQLVTQTRDAN